jgi:hypothetical protein
MNCKNSILVLGPAVNILSSLVQVLVYPLVLCFQYNSAIMLAGTHPFWKSSIRVCCNKVYVLDLRLMGS